MNRKNQIYEVFLQSKEQGFTANEIAQKLGLDRANVSSDLNKLVKEELLIKTNSRPVVFKLLSHTLQQTNKSQIKIPSSDYKYEYFYEENIINCICLCIPICECTNKNLYCIW